MRATLASRLGPSHHGEIGRLEHLAALDRTIDGNGVDGLDRRAGIARRLPVQLDALRHIERHVEARRARVIGQREHLQFAGHIGLDLQRAHVAVEIDQDIARIAEAVLAGQRLSDAGGDFPRGDGAAGARHDDFGKPAGVDADELVRPDRVENAVGRDRARRAEIGRAEDRHVGDRPGIFDEIADGDDVAGDGDARLERRQRRGRRGLRGRRAAQRQQQREACDHEPGHGRDPSHFISCEVVCSISSAAVMTLEFIS